MRKRRRRVNILAEIRLTPPRRARRRMAGLVMPWMLSRRIFRWRLAPPFPRPFPPLPPAEPALVRYQEADMSLKTSVAVDDVLTSSHVDRGEIVS